MSEPTHFEKVVSYVMSNDKSELTNMTAERDYALHCLEREIAIAHQAQARIATLEEVLGRIARGGEAVLLSAELDECPVNPKVLEQIVKEAHAALAPETEK